MKILQVITSLQIGGAEKLISEISPLLRDKGHEVDVLAFDGVEHISRDLSKRLALRSIASVKTVMSIIPL